MRIIGDFHFHSKYSRATSKNMVIETIGQWAKWKGLDIVGTADCTHPFWVNELKQKLEESSPGSGLYKLKGDDKSPLFVISGEVSCIYSQGGRTRRIHTLFLVPSWEALDKINERLGKVGKVYSDGRPILGMSARDLAQIIWEGSEDCMVIPAHIWTPWFSLFGSNSGYNAVEECYGDLSSKIYALETGLSADPEMCWRLSALDKYTLVSNSDAHSPLNMMREANIFDLEELTYHSITQAIKKKDKKKFLYTIEYFPQEGMYHWDGHRAHDLSMSPEEAEKLDNICPECKKQMTIGVEHRVFDLADRESGFMPEGAIPFKKMMPLDEIVAKSLGINEGTKGVEKEYMNMVTQYGSEFSVLYDRTAEELLKNVDGRIVEGIMRVRDRKLKIKPGYDGVYGKVEIFGEEEKSGSAQGSLF